MVINKGSKYSMEHLTKKQSDACKIAMNNESSGHIVVRLCFLIWYIGIIISIFLLDFNFKIGSCLLTVDHF